MGRNAKSKYARTVNAKFRISPEHLHLVADVRSVHPDLSDADVFIYAVEEFAARHCKGKIRFIPNSRPKAKDKARTGRQIIIGKSI